MPNITLCKKNYSIPADYLQNLVSAECRIPPEYVLWSVSRFPIGWLPSPCVHCCRVRECRYHHNQKYVALDMSLLSCRGSSVLDGALMDCHHPTSPQWVNSPTLHCGRWQHDNKNQWLVNNGAVPKHGLICAFLETSPRRNFHWWCFPRGIITNCFGLRRTTLLVGPRYCWQCLRPSYYYF